MKLAVTIDTEADCQWQPGIPVTTRNVACWPPFRDLCDRHGVTPTYLVTSEIAMVPEREFSEPTLIEITYSYEQATLHRKPPMGFED